MTGRRRRRLAAAVLVASACVLVPTASSAQFAPTSSRPVLEDGDAVELANKLAEATADQDVCYGWIVNIQDDDAGFSSDRGSSYGPDRDPYAAECAPSVVFVADVHYTSSLSEAPDRADVHVESTLPGLDVDDDVLRRFGVEAKAMLGDKDDVAVMNATAALPLLVAEAGLAPPVAVEETTGTIPSSDRPTGDPGSDRLRTYWPLYFFAAAIVLCGLAWFVVAFFLRSVANAPRPAYPTSFSDDD